MYRRMGPKKLKKLAEITKQDLSREDFEKARNALIKANIQGPYRAIQSPDAPPIVDRP